jgi:hypothetical protein
MMAKSFLLEHPTMSLISDLNSKIKELTAKAQKAGPAMAESAPSQKALDAAIKAETRARNAATKMLEAEAAQKKAAVPALKAEARLSAFTSRTEEQQARAYQAANRLGIGKAGHKAASGGAASGGGGMELGALARFASPMAAGFAAMRGVDWSTQALNTAQRNDLSETQRNNIIGESIPVLGSMIESMRKFGDALDGTTEAVRRAQIRHEENVIRGVSAYDVNERRQNLKVPPYAAWLHVQATEEMPYRPLARQDMMTPWGRIAAANTESREPLQQAAVRSQRGVFVARGVFEHRDRVLNARLAHLHDLERLRGPLGENPALAGPQPGMALGMARMGNFSGQMIERMLGYNRNAGQGESVLGRVQDADVARERNLVIERARSAVEEARGQREAAAGGLAQAELTARRDLVAILQQEKTIVEQKLSRLSEQAGRFGGMNPVEQQVGVNALRMIDRFGIENVPMEMRGHAAAVAPQWMREQEMRAAERNPRYRELQAMRDREGVPFVEQGSRAESIGQREAARAEIRMNMVIDERVLGERIAERLQGPLRDLLRAVEIIEDRLFRLQGEQAARNATEGN